MRGIGFEGVHHVIHVDEQRPYKIPTTTVYYQQYLGSDVGITWRFSKTGFGQNVSVVEKPSVTCACRKREGKAQSEVKCVDLD